MTEVGTRVLVPPPDTGNTRLDSVGFLSVATLAARVALYSGIRSATPVLAVPLDAANDLTLANE